MNTREVIRKIIEESKDHYSFSSTQFQCDDVITNKVRAFHFEPEQLHFDETGGMGKEDDVHCTILYGLHMKELEPELVDYMSNVEPFYVTMGNISYFDCDDYDVMKIEVQGNELHNLHNGLKETFENTQSFPEFNPHVTIAYIKKGYNRGLVDNYAFIGNKMLVDKLSFSSRDGDKTVVPFKQAELTLK